MATIMDPISPWWGYLGPSYLGQIAKKFIELTYLIQWTQFKQDRLQYWQNSANTLQFPQIDKLWGHVTNWK